MRTLTTLTTILFLAPYAHSAIVLDVASNYGGGWTNGTNNGTGFGAWVLNNNDNGSTIFGGNFLGSSTAGAADIDTAGNSFGLYANPASAFSTATRTLQASLTTNDQFTVDLALNFDNGNKGFNLRTGGSTVFGFNVGSGASTNTSFTNNPTAASYDYGGNAALTLTMTMTSATSLDYNVSRTSSQGTQGTLFAGSITGIVGPVDGFEFYNSGTDDGSAQNNLYFNNLNVTTVPEPSTPALLGLGFGSLACFFRSRKK